MDYIINGERVNLLDIVECDIPFQLTEEYVNEFNYLNTDAGFTKNILKKEDIGKWIFIIKVEKDSFKRLNNMGSLYPAKIKQDICSKPYGTEKKHLIVLKHSLNSSKKNLKRELLKFNIICLQLTN